MNASNLAKIQKTITTNYAAIIAGSSVHPRCGFGMTLLRISGNQSILPYFLCYTLLLVQSCNFTLL